MRPFRVLAFALAGSLALIGLVMGTAAAEDIPVPPEPGYDYALLQGPDTGTVGDICDQTLDARVGNWVCPVADTGEQSSADLLAGDVEQAVYSATGLAIGGTGGSGYCNAKACWDVYSTTLSDMRANAYFGYDRTVIGTVDMYYQVRMNGALNVDTNVWLESSVNLTHLIVTGERLYYSAAYPGGNGVNDGRSRALYGPVNVSAYQRLTAWPSTGYQYYEDTVAHSGVVHEWSWNVSGYPGTWYFFAKSVKMDRRSSGAYWFGGPNYLGSEAARGGWHW